jgi:hypothetical protein
MYNSPSLLHKLGSTQWKVSHRRNRWKELKLHYLLSSKNKVLA